MGNLTTQQPVVFENPLPNGVDYSNEIISQVKVAKEYFMTSTDVAAGRTYEERVRNLSIAVKKLFENFLIRRRPQYEAVRFNFSGSDWATGKTTPKTEYIETNKYVFYKIEKSPTGGDWKGGPVINGVDKRDWIDGDIDGGDVYWKTGGHGRATTSWKIYARYSIAGINFLVEQELIEIRRQLHMLSLPSDLFVENPVA